MKRIFSISILNFKSAVKEKIFIGLVFLFIFLLAVSMFLAKLGVGESVKVLRNAGLVGIEITGLLLVIFSLVFSFYREKNSRMQEIYLSFVSRCGYISGKLLGYVFLLFSYLVIAIIGYGLILYFNNAFSLNVFAGIYPIFLKLSIVLFFTFLFCVIFNSSLVALFTSFFVYFSSELSKYALDVLIENKTEGIQLFLLKSIYHIFPNFDMLDIKSQAAYLKLPSLYFFQSITFYSVAYLIFLYFLICILFKKSKE